MMNPLLKVLKIEFREFCSGISLRSIDDIFSKAGFVRDESNINTRRDLVESYYEKVDWENSETIQKFLLAIEYTLQLHYLEETSKEYLRKLCREAGFTIDEKTNRISYEGIVVNDLFSYQFPVGLPFGLLKPNFAIKAEKGGQILCFELQEGMGLISFNVYPNLTFRIASEINYNDCG